jgi:hypothetical protein
VVQTVTGTVTAVGSGALTILSSAGQSETLQATAGELAGLQAGELAQVTYTQGTSGALTAESVTPEGSSSAAQIAGTITVVSQSSVTIQPSTGTALTLSTAERPALLDVYLAGVQDRDRGVREPATEVRPGRCRRRSGRLRWLIV